MSKENKQKKREAKNVRITCLFEILIFCVLIVIFACFIAYRGENGEGTLGYFHNLGDAIGGLSAPIIGLISSLLVYLSFQAQIDANEITTDIRDDEKKEEEQDRIVENLRQYLDRIENKFRWIAEKFGGERRFNFLIILLADSYGLIDGDAMDRFRTNENEYKIDLEIESRPLVGELDGLLKNCEFFCDYIIRINKKSNIDDDTRDFISLSIAEFTFFIRNKIGDFYGFKSLDPKNAANTGFDQWFISFLNQFFFIQERLKDLDEVDKIYMNPITRDLHR